MASGQGDRVWAYDLVRGTWRLCRVKEPYRLPYQGTVVRTTVAGAVVEATYRHPYWVVCGEGLAGRPWLEHLAFIPEDATTPGRWVDSCDLRVGDEVLLRDGRVVPVEAQELFPFEGTVYNLEVEELQCYAVGPHGVLVHNNNGPQTGPEGANAPEGGFRDPKNPAQRTLWDLTPEPRPTRVPNPHLEGKTPMPGSRGTGVSRAAAQEVELVKRTGKGTLDWTPEEIEYINKTGQLPDGIVGHHINNVAQFPEWAGDPRNIKFVRGQTGNLAEHGGNFQTPTTGSLIDRRAMMNQGTGGS